MPKEITHILFASESLKKITTNSKKLSNILSVESDSYKFGAVATDSFYYSIKTPFEKDYFQWGDLVHGAEGNDTTESVLQALKNLKNNPKDEQFNSRLAFITGFISHIALDVNFHPYVYYFSGNYYDPLEVEKVNAMMRHRLIEAWIDLYLLNKNNLSLKTFKDIKKVFSNHKVNLDSLKFLSHFYKFNFKIEKDLFMFLKKGYFIQATLNRKIINNYALYQLLKPINKLLDNKLRDYMSLFYPNDISNIPDYIVNFEKYSHPVTGDIFEGNINVIWNDALDMSNSFFNEIENYIWGNGSFEQLKQVIKGYSLDVGLEGIKVHDSKFFSPWELELH
jgi:hypothetical protein